MVAVCPVTPILPRTLSACVAMSKPATWRVAAVGVKNVVRIRTVVVLPAPLRPEQRAHASRPARRGSRPRAACVSPNDRARCCAEMAKLVMGTSRMRGGIGIDHPEGGAPTRWHTNPMGRDFPAAFSPGGSFRVALFW